MPHATRYRVAALPELEPVPWKPGLDLWPIRSILGLRAFGAGIYVGEAEGDLVVEPHRETDPEGLGHEELYVVLKGRVRFTIDGGCFSAEAVSLIAADPEAHREAVAETANATVLVVGGPPDRTPAGHEHIARVRAVTDEPDRALAIAMAPAG